MALTKITATNIGSNAVTANSIGYTPANKAGDTFTGDISLSSTTTPNFYINSSNTSVNQNLWFRSNGTDTFGIEAQSNTGGSGAFLSNRSNSGAINLRTTTGGSLQTSMTIDGAGRVTMPYQPAFLAYGDPSKDGSSYVYGFSGIQVNTGSYYNNTNGRFTAPVTARYFFTAGIWAVGGQNNYLALYVNGSQFNAGHIYATSSFASSGYVSGVLSLNAGDYVNLWCGYSIQGSTPRNYFSGYQIG